MAKTTIVAGKDMPAGSKFVDGLRAGGRQIVVTGADTNLNSVQGGAERKTSRRRTSLAHSSGIITLGWNRSSPISSRTLIMGAEREFDKIDEVILFFDEDMYASKDEQRMDLEECARTCDNMILGYQYLALETLEIFLRRNAEDGQKAGTLVFLLKEGLSIAEAVKNPSLQNNVYSLSSPILAAASANFVAFAENLAATQIENDKIDIVLIRGDKSLDSMGNESNLGLWIAKYIDESEGGKQKGSQKRPLQWIKPGVRVSQGGISGLFKK